MKKIILFQGDSITDGNRIKNNTTDLNHQIGHSYAYVVTGKLTAEYPQAGLQFFNRGISGNTVQNLADRWQEDCLLLKPDVLSILVGVNDVHYAVFDDRPFCEQTFVQNCESLIARARSVNPNVKIILCEPFALCTGTPAPQWKNWGPLLGEVQGIVRRVAGDCNVFFLPLQELFNEKCKLREESYWLWDGIHPTEAGHWLIAQAWLDFVQKNNILGLR